MQDISPIIGENIRFYRKRLQLTQEGLGKLINKGKATVAKYESGQIILDVQTLYEVAKALCVNMDQLLYVQEETKPLLVTKSIPNFFKDVSKLYIYFYDGRNKSLNESVMLISPLPREDGIFEAKLFFNVESIDRYQLCEYTYVGKLVHYDVISIFTLQNKTMDMEELKIVIPASYNDEMEKFAHFSGVSSRPLMPVTFKILVTKQQKKHNAELIKQLKLSKYDMKMLKFYNMFTVT
ncbi:helix-turn-helix domain-containing protein [Amygdalobacter nucleatus]|uniref:DNA-binding helix-turn-helix protein n=1 Tax=Amygdalobacter nucleatus TaxID=3029274 RepID=A0A133Y967_9FIRM|nr:helix-turn-helix transcriptional regulator [Amygdalobacter nucleatus]KXB39720.1 DNA-binding helix-turn-helix protein [Amygdalobacter nucleatus]MDF0486335.1 helix-turn-helix transcriptional regulator [Amygdalobacter nucleatus]